MEKGVYRDSFARTHQPHELVNDFETLLAYNQIVSVPGRVIAKRVMGKVTFFIIADSEGKIQCFGDTDHLGDDGYTSLVRTIKIGDIIGTTGHVFVTRRGEKTIMADRIELLTTALLPLPEKWHGLTDLETRYRQRYLDLIANENTRRVFRMRSKIIAAMRHRLEKDNFTEVETPIFQKNPCGASANPFVTHHDAKDINLYMRISPETFLKQLVVGGMDRVYEIGKNFRNEGLDASHLQEFTMLEYYASYWNYRDNMRYIRELIQHVTRETLGILQINYQGIDLDFAAEWRVVEYRDLVLEDSGIDVLAFNQVADLLRVIREHHIDLGEVPPHASFGTVIDKLYKRVSRPKLVQPTFLLHHPAVLMPLARPNDKDPRIIDSFQVLVNGWEIAKAYSELGDPNLQRRLLEEQVTLRSTGDDEAMFLDTDFLTSLEYGMPPVSGAGIGIDRFAAILTNQRNLTDVVLFPLLR